MPTFAYTLSYAGVGFTADVPKTIRKPGWDPFAGGGGGSPVPPEHLPPRKHQPDPDLLAEVDRLLPKAYLTDYVQPPEYLGRNLGQLARPDGYASQPEADELRVGDWYYPSGAGRFSVFRGLATSAQAEAMILATNGGATAATFLMGAVPLGAATLAGYAPAYTLTSPMFMLPARPLGETFGKFDGLFLVTLVDERYYFQGTPATVQPTTGLTWAALANQLATALGIAPITLPAFAAPYTGPEADSQFWANYDSAPALLDAVAANVGCTVVRALNGTYALTPFAASATTAAANRGAAESVIRAAGGDIFSSGVSKYNVDRTLARNAVVPTTVYVTFPKYVYGDDPVPHFVNPRYGNQRPSAWYEDSYGDVYAVPVPIGSGGGAPDASGNVPASAVSGLAGVSTQYLHTTAKALYSGEAGAASGGVPDNASGLTALALQCAGDYYAGKVSAALDEVYPGTVAWTPEGFHDVVWTYSAKAKGAFTRVMRTAWNAGAAELQHATPALSGLTATPRGVGGHAVAQTWRDQDSISGTVGGNAAVSWLLAAPLLSGDTQALLAGAGGLPTQNRWRGTVSLSGQPTGEVILFEGCSGAVGSTGTAVGIAYRGVDGTTQASGLDAGDIVTQLAPNNTYGVNCVTFQKGQFVYPGAWTSGGVQEAVVVPQAQTVYSAAGSGVQLGGSSGALYWSGLVQSVDPTQSGFPQQFFSGEGVWLVERNGGALRSGQRYGGQLVGYSMSGPVAPVYLVDGGHGPTFIISGTVLTSGLCITSGANSGNLSLTFSTLVLMIVDGDVVSGGIF